VGEFAQAVSGQRVEVGAAMPAQRWTVGIPRAYPWGDLSPSAEMALALATQVLSDAGARVVACDLPAWAGQSFHAHDAVQGWEAARALALEIDTGQAQLSPLLRDYLLAARGISDETYAFAQAVARRARAQCREWLPGIDVLLTPSAPDEPPVGFATTGASTFNRAWTLLGAPCVNVPGAIGVNGRPMGLQVIAPPGKDNECLAAGAMLDALLRP
jgi:Asp-tRNA(Asn)/Glu-tRNA(Gln) amidotransferase A subunit family amidase